MAPLSDDLLKPKISIAEEMLRARDGREFDSGILLLSHLFMTSPYNYDILRMILQFSASDLRFGKTFLAQVMKLGQKSAGKTDSDPRKFVGEIEKQKLALEMLQVEKQKLEAELGVLQLEKQKLEAAIVRLKVKSKK